MAREQFESSCRVVVSFHMVHKREPDPLIPVRWMHYELSNVARAAAHPGSHGTHQIISPDGLEDIVGIELALEIFQRLHKRLYRKIVVNLRLAQIRELL